MPCVEVKVFEDELSKDQTKELIQRTTDAVTTVTSQKLRDVLILITGGLLALISVSVFAANEPNQKIMGVAIKGYDPVAYFTENRAVKGDKEYSYNWHDATWYFSKPENRDLFAANPERYAPQFGGYCATGVSKGKLLEADPKEWTIVDGKLYLNYDRSSRDILRQHKTDTITRAEKNWVKLHN